MVKYREEFLAKKEISQCLDKISQDFPGEEYSVEILLERFDSFLKPGMEDREMMSVLIKAAVELTAKEAPKWELIAARLLYCQFKSRIEDKMKERGIRDFYGKIRYLTEEGLYGSYILEGYSEEELTEAAGFLEESRNELFTYSGLDLLPGR